MNKPELDSTTKEQLDQLINLKTNKSKYFKYGIASIGTLGIIGFGYYIYNKFNNKSENSKLEENKPAIEENCLISYLEDQTKPISTSEINHTINNNENDDFYKFLDLTQNSTAKKSPLEEFDAYLETNFKQNVEKEKKYKEITDKFEKSDFNELYTKFINTLSDEQWEFENINEILENIFINPLILYKDTPGNISEFINLLNNEQIAIKCLMIKKFILENQ